MSVRPRIAAALLLLLPALAPRVARADEVLSYHWHLEGFVGMIASLFVPPKGAGELSVRRTPAGTLQSELLITSDEALEGEYFRYGAEWEPESGRTLRAWSAYRWRGETKDKRDDVDQTGVVDIVSAIHLLRIDPPASARRMEIWSDGRLYPVVVLPRQVEQIEVGDRVVAARHFTVRGVDLPERRQWKGQLDLWISLAPHATPVEMVVTRKGARVRLELDEMPDEQAPPGETATSGDDQ